jgi:membrane protein YdbS with pleckstrin-like domain
MTEKETKTFKVGDQKVLETFRPNKKYKIILITQILLIYLGILITIWASVIAVPINEVMGWLEYSLIVVGSSLPFCLIILMFVNPYFKAINYELTTQEIIVHKGIITKSTKIVPYRNITNFVMRRGLLHRMIGGDNFGTIVVETAGQGPQQAHPEQRIVGIMNLAEYTEKIRSILAKMKGQAGISADTETASSLDEEVILTKILATLEKIETKL